MKQLIRFFFKPATFVNQLQWSKNHGLILMIFLGIAVMESQFGIGRSVNLQLSWLLSDWTGWDRDQALFLVTAGRMGFLLLTVLCLAEALWWVGNQIGSPSSKRVLYRRLVVVLTLVLASYSFFASVDPNAQIVGAALFGWGFVMGYSTFREQFQVGAVTAAFVGLIAIASMQFSWQLTDRVVQTAASHAIAKQVARASKH